MSFQLEQTSELKPSSPFGAHDSAEPGVVDQESPLTSSPPSKDNSDELVQPAEMSSVGFSEFRPRQRNRSDLLKSQVDHQEYQSIKKYVIIIYMFIQGKIPYQYKEVLLSTRALLSFLTLCVKKLIKIGEAVFVFSSRSSV